VGVCGEYETLAGIAHGLQELFDMGAQADGFGHFLMR
jgi:hypothetical protein